MRARAIFRNSFLGGRLSRAIREEREREGRREREKAATVRNILVENEATAKDGRERWKKDAGNTKAREEKE